MEARGVFFGLSWKDYLAETGPESRAMAKYK